MDRQRMQQALASRVPEEVRLTMVEVLEEGYQVAASRYDESIGCNSITFGTDLYQFVRFHFQGCGDPATAPITLGHTESELELRLSVGGFTFACHRVGSSKLEDIAESFPSSAGGPGRLARQNAHQLEFDLPASGEELLPQNVVIAHLGNPDTGLEAVYFAVPSSTSAVGKINGWAYTELLWEWDGERTEGFPVADLPPSIPIPEAEIRLRSTADSTERESS
jgi:hypothetical protein